MKPQVNFFRCFLEEIKDIKKTFRNYLTFRKLTYILKKEMPMCIISCKKSSIYCASNFFILSSHCSKGKMKGKKLSQCQFHFPGLLGTSLMSKQETKFFFIVGHQSYSHLSDLVSRWTGPRIFLEMSKVEFFIVIQLWYNELWSFSH